MENVISVSNMRKSDAHTIEHHTSSKELMRRAAQGVYDSVDFKGSRVAIICGGGNNGGDGYALAEIFAEIDEFESNDCYFQEANEDEE